MISDVFVAVAITSVIAIILGILLYVSQVVFYVKEDERVVLIYDLLPHYDCGACGTAGCMDMANQLVAQEIKVAKCKPAKPEQKAVIQEKLDNMFKTVES